MIEQSSNMNKILNKINEFFVENELESDEIIG